MEATPSGCVGGKEEEVAACYWVGGSEENDGMAGQIDGGCDALVQFGGDEDNSDEGEAHPAVRWARAGCRRLGELDDGELEARVG